jgi:hypothetical protein
MYLNLATAGDSVVIDPSMPAGINELSTLNSGFEMFPNPANENITVQTHKTTTLIEVTDMLGRVITSNVPSGGITTINTAAFAEGVYLVRVHYGNAVLTEKLSVTH